MSLEENKAIVRRVVEAANEQNLSAMDELVASDFVDHKRQLRGLEALNLGSLAYAGSQSFLP